MYVYVCMYVCVFVIFTWAGPSIPWSERVEPSEVKQSSAYRDIDFESDFETMSRPFMLFQTISKQKIERITQHITSKTLADPQSVKQTNIN